MAYFIAFAFVIGGFVTNDSLMFVAAGCFAISGAIAYSK